MKRILDEEFEKSAGISFDEYIDEHFGRELYNSLDKSQKYMVYGDYVALCLSLTKDEEE